MEPIKIGHSQYSVIETECVNKFTPRKGEIDFYARQIKLDADMSNDDKKETLLHEIIHGLEDFMGLDFEEGQVRSLGLGLAMVFKDNQHLLDFLKE